MLQWRSLWWCKSILNLNDLHQLLDYSFGLSCLITQAIIYSNSAESCLALQRASLKPSLLQSGTVSQPYLFFGFHDLNTFEKLFFRMFFKLGLSDVSSWLNVSCVFWARISLERRYALLMNPMRKSMMSMCHIYIYFYI